jgi:hypothetical protein
MAEYEIVKANGEVIQFATDLNLDEAAGLVDERLNGDFPRSLLKAWAIKRISYKQELWLLKLAADLQQPQNAKPGRYQALVAAIQRMQEGRKGRVVLRLDGVTIKACTRGGNAGGAYLFRGEDYIGKITPAGELFGARTTAVFDADALEDVLLAAAADPQAAAIAYGKATGNCACCGRQLTDPVSVFGGIGPICLERLAGPAARRELEAAFKAHQADALQGALELVAA